MIKKTEVYLEDYVIWRNNIYRENFESDDIYKLTLIKALMDEAVVLIGRVSYVNAVEKSVAKNMWTIINELELRDYADGSNINI